MGLGGSRPSQAGSLRGRRRKTAAILSLDGGGSRGVMELVVLDAIYKMATLIIEKPQKMLRSGCSTVLVAIQHGRASALADQHSFPIVWIFIFSSLKLYFMFKLSRMYNANNLKWLLCELFHLKEKRSWFTLSLVNSLPYCTNLYVFHWFKNPKKYIHMM